MDTPSTIAVVVSSLSFGAYGLACFLDKRMVAEFERYRAARIRVLTGALQLAASIGLVVGLSYAPLLVLSATGLAVMMLAALAVRVRIRDPLYAALPALAYLLLNVFIVWRTVRTR